MAEGIFHTLKRLIVTKPKGIDRIANPLIAQEEANTILGIDNEEAKKGYSINRGAVKKLRERTHDVVLTAQADKTVKAEGEAMIEPLTKLFSRRYFDAQLKEELNEADRLNLPIGIAVGDIRKFKIVNDTHGHLTGDEVLQSVAASLVEGTRKSDIVSRTGGDELAMIYTVLKPKEEGVYDAKDNLVTAAIRALHKIHANPVTRPDGGTEKPHLDLGITLSVPEDTVKSIYDRADQASYLAKKLFMPGDDKVVIATQMPKGIVYEIAQIGLQGNVRYSAIENVQELVHRK